MPYDAEPLKSYVRFYLAVVSQLERVWSSVVAIEVAMRKELEPFAEALAPVDLPALRTLLDPPREPPEALAALWRPEDAEELSGLADLYEVVGRFSFEGEGRRNLADVQSLVSAARNAVHEDGEALRALSALGRLSRETADAVEKAERARAAALRVERTQKIEPMLELVLLRAKQTQDALRAVSIPALEDGKAAAEEYKRLRQKLQQVWQTCLPFLRSAIAQVWQFVGAAVPQSFPDELPLVAELPPDLLDVSLAGTGELEQAERTLAELAEEAKGLVRTKEDLATQLAKLDGELAGAAVKREELAQEIELARALFEWVRLGEQAEALRAREAEVERELRAHVTRAGEAREALEVLRAAAGADAEQLAKRAAELEAAKKELEELSKKEPLLFGKDDWRARVAAGGARVEELRGLVAQASQVDAQRRMDLSAGDVRVQTLVAEASIVDRGLVDLRGRLAEVTRGFEALGERLGKQRPTRLVPLREVEEVVVALEARQAEADRGIEALRASQRRAKEDGVRVLAREKQIEVLRQSAQARVQSAKVAHAEGLDAATRRLAEQRKAAVAEHVEDVLGALGKSLVQVPAVFLEPARALVLTQTEPDLGVAERLRKAAVDVEPVVARLAAERGPELSAAEGLLGKIQTEFCDAAAEACRSAWG